MEIRFRAKIVSVTLEEVKEGNKGKRKAKLSLALKPLEIEKHENGYHYKAELFEEELETIITKINQNLDEKMRIENTNSVLVLLPMKKETIQVKCEKPLLETIVSFLIPGRTLLVKCKSISSNKTEQGSEGQEKILQLTSATFE